MVDNCDCEKVNIVMIQQHFKIIFSAFVRKLTLKEISLGITVALEN